jgi:hypothetical protein
MKSILRLCSLLLLVSITSCLSVPKKTFDITEYQVYDAPVKSQVSIRAILKDSITSKNVEDLLKTLFDKAKDEHMKSGKEPTHIFVFVYASKADENDDAKWVGKMTREMGKDSPPELKIGLTNK